MERKNLTIDIAKGIAIILVVYGHVIEHSLTPWCSQEYYQNPVFKIIYTFHMPLFVFISGYLMANSLKKHSLKDVFESRCKSLFFPFVCLAVLCTIMTIVLSIIFGSYTGRINIVEDLADQLLLKPQVWFLFTLFAVSCLLLYSVRLEKRFGVLIFVPMYILLMGIPYNNTCALYYIKWFYLFYLAGYFFNRFRIKIPRAAVKMMIYLGSLAIFAWLLTYWTENDFIYNNKMNLEPNQYFQGSLRFIYRYIMGFLGIIIAFNMAGDLSKTKASSVLGYIGTYALDIYIIQMFLVEGLYPRLISKWGIHLDLNSMKILYIAAPLLSIFFVGASILISKFLIRKTPILNRFLLGGRA